uniref:Uncharacterized protein n=1 Tax=Timema douglasi TaxID=61478 RepID=A0A7R8Z3C7_TIMDO|nr:unnamed protein product [Timema douglasi]
MDTQKTNDQSQSANEVGTQTHSRDELHPHDVQRMLQLLEKSSQLSPQLAKLLKDHFSSSESTTLVREESMEEAQGCADIWPDVCYDNQKEPHPSNRREQNNLTSHRKSSRSASALKRRPRLAPLRSVTPQVGSEPSFVVAAGTSGFRSADRSGRNVVSEDTNPISQGLYSELSPHYYTSVIAEMLDIDKEFERLSKRKLELYKKFNFIPGLAERLNNNSSPSPRATSPMESERLLANNNAGLNQEALDVVANIGGSNNIMPLLSTRLMSKLDVVSPSMVLQNPSSEDPGLNSRVRTDKKSPKVVVKPLELTKDEDKGEDDEDINLSNLRKGQIKEKDTEAKRSVRQSGSNESNEKTHIRDSRGRRRKFLNESHSEIKSSEPRSKRRHIDEGNESDLTPRNPCRKVRNLNDDIKAIEKPTNFRNENIHDVGKSPKVKNKRGKCVDEKELVRENEIRTFTNDQELAPTFDVENSKGKHLNKEQMEAKQEDVRRSRTLSRGKNKEVSDTSEISNKMEKGSNDEKEISKSVERSSRKDSKTLKNYQSLSNEKDKDLNKNSEIDSKLSESKSRQGRHSYRDSKNLKMSKSTSSRARSNEKKQVEHKENEIQEFSNTKNDPKGRKEINLKDEIQKEVKDSYATNSPSVKRDDSQPRTFRKIKPSEEFPVSEGATMLRTRRATKETRDVMKQIMPRRKSSVKSYNENVLSGDWEEITGRIKARRDRSLDASSETEEFSRPVSVTRKQFSRPRRQTKQSQESTELIETATEHTQQSLESTPKRKSRQISKEEETPLESPVESRTTRRRSLSKSESSSDILLTPELTRKKNTKKGPSSQIDLEHSSTLSDISDEGLVTPVIKKVGDSKSFRDSPVDFVSGRTSNLGDLTSGKRSHLGDHSSGRRSRLGDPSSGRRSRLGDSSSGRRSCLGDPISGGRSHSGDATKDILDTSLDSISSEQEKDSGRGKKRKADELESLPTNVSKIAASSNLKKCFIFIEPLSMEKLEMTLGSLANTSTSIPEEHSIVEVETEEMAISEPPVIDHYEPNEEIPKLNSGEKSPTMEELQQEFHSGVIVENIDLPCATQEFLKIPECANIDENSFSVSDSVSLMSDGDLRRQREDCDRDSSYSFDTPTHSVGTPCHSFGTPTHSLGTPTHDWGERASSRQGKHKSSKKHKRDKKSDSPDHLTFETHSGPILDIKTVGRHILAASEDSNVYCYSLKSGKFKRKYEGHTAAVTCLSVMEVSPHTGGETPSELDGGEQEAQIYSASLDTYLRSFMFRSGELVHEPQSTGSPVQCMDQNWGYVYLGTKTGEVARFNIKRSCMVGDHLRMSQESILAIKATKEGPRKVLIIGTRSQPISIRDATNDKSYLEWLTMGLLLRSMNGNWTHTVYSLLLESSLVYCGTSTGDIPVFEFTTGHEVCRLKAGFGVVCMRLYNNMLFAGCYDGGIYVFSVQDKTLMTCITGPGKMLLCMDILKNMVGNYELVQDNLVMSTGDSWQQGGKLAACLGVPARTEDYKVCPPNQRESKDPLEYKTAHNKICNLQQCGVKSGGRLFIDVSCLCMRPLASGYFHITSWLCACLFRIASTGKFGDEQDRKGRGQMWLQQPSSRIADKTSSLDENLRAGIEKGVHLCVYALMLNRRYTTGKAFPTSFALITFCWRSNNVTPPMEP